MVTRPLGVPTTCPCPSLRFFGSFSPQRILEILFQDIADITNFTSLGPLLVFPQPGKDLCSLSRHFISHKVWRIISTLNRMNCSDFTVTARVQKDANTTWWRCSNGDPMCMGELPTQYQLYFLSSVVVVKLFSHV